MNSPDVCIRGAGAVGMSLALSLARQGLAVQLLASPAGLAPAAPDVRTYALNAGARDLLAALKVWDALPADAVTAVDDMVVAGDAPGAQIEFSAWQQGAEALAWIVDAAALDDALATAVRFAPHISCQTDSAVGVAGGAALTVLAEGKASASRSALGVRFERHAYGQTALAARLVSNVGHGQLARQWFGAPDVLALLPFDRPQVGHSYGLVWSLPAARAEALRDAPVAEFEAALAEATGGAAGHLRLGSERATWPLAIAQADRLCGPGWVLVGDAAHLVHPLAGQGLNLGLADVVSLSRIIAEREPWRALGDERLLRRHVRARSAPTQAMALLTDGLLHLFAQPQPLVKELRNRGLSLLNQLTSLKRVLTRHALDV